MEKAQLNGVDGYYDKGTETFYPGNSISKASLNGVDGYYHAESETFLPSQEAIEQHKETASIFQKTTAAFGRGLGNMSRLLHGFIGPEGIGADPTIPKTEQEMQEWKSQRMQERAAMKDPANKETMLRVIQNMERKFVDYQNWRQTNREGIDRVNSYLDNIYKARDPKMQPEGIIQEIAYGLVEFIPESPVYSAFGGPAASMVEESIAAVARRFGPKIAEGVAKTLPELLKKAGKYAAEEVAPHALGQGVGAVATELAAGSDPVEAAKKGVEFAGATAVFKPAIDAAKGFAKAATKKYEAVAKPYTKVEKRKEGDGDDRPLRGEKLEGERYPREETTAEEFAREVKIGELEEQIDAAFKNLDYKKGIELEKELLSVKYSKQKEMSFEQMEEELKKLPAKETRTTIDGEPKPSEHNPHLPEVVGVEEIPFFEEAFRGAEKHAPVKTFFDATRKLAEKIPDYFKNIPALTRHDMQDEAFYLANAKNMIPKVVDDLISKVIPGHYTDEKAKQAITRWFVKDRLIANHDANKKLLATMQERLSAIPDEKVSAEEDILHNTKLLNQGDPVKSKEYRNALNEATKKREAILKEEQELSGKVAAQEYLIKQQLEAHDIERYRRKLKRDWEDNKITVYDDKGNIVYTVNDVKGIAYRWKEHINPFLDQLYRDTAHLTPDVQIDQSGQYGHFSGANVRLIHKDSPYGGTKRTQKGKYEDKSYEESSLIPSRGSSQAKMGDWSKRAHGTGDYTTYLEKNLMGALERVNESSAKERFFKKAQKQGVMVFSDTRPDAVLPDGIKWVQLQDGKVERPVYNPTTGKTEMVARTPWVRSDVRQEIRNVLDLDPNHGTNPFLQLATTVQIKQLADFVVHGKNLLSEVTRAQGKGPIKDLISKIPIIGQADAAGSIRNVFKEMQADSPRIRAEMAELAKLGALRPEHGQDDLIKTSHVLWKIDTASRVLMNRYYTRLVRRGLAEKTPTARRDFILQVGQYNDRLMNSFKRRVRRFGLSPFLVAGETFNRNAIRTLATSYSGAKAADKQGEDYMTTVNTIGTVMAATVPMMVNAFTTGSVFGRPGTKLFSIDLGLPQNEDGSIDQIDLGQISGHRRGMRLLGIDAIVEGARAGQSTKQIAGKAVTDTFRSITHPYIGPGASFLEETLPDLSKGKMTTDKAIEALGKLNPAFAAFGTPKYGPLEIRALAASEGKETGDAKLARYLDSLLESPSGAFGYKKVKPYLSEMETMVVENRARGLAKSEESLKNHRGRQLADAAYKKGGDQAMYQVLENLWNTGQVKNRDTLNAIWRDRKLSELQRGFKSLSPEIALDAFEQGTPKEKAQTYVLLAKKIERYEGKHADYQKFYERALAAKENVLSLLMEGKIKQEDIYQLEEE